jgi:DNA-binding beta-propeller fold protein YncE
MKYRQATLKITGIIVTAAAVLAVVYLLKYPAGAKEETEGPVVREAGQARYLYSIKVRHRDPRAIAFREGKLAVAYEGTDRVETYSPGGTYEGSFSAMPGMAMSPAAMGRDGSGGLYLSDAANRAVLVFDGKNAFQYPFPPRKTAPGDADFIVSPGDVFINGGNVLITDTGDPSVKVFTAGGEFMMALTDWNREGEGFLRPAAVVQLEDGRIVVADVRRKQVGVFSCAGKSAYYFEDPQEGPLKRPGALAADSSGNIHVLDAGAGKVFVYDNFGKYLTAYGGPGRRGGGMSEPMDIEADPGGRRIFIADSGNNEIDVWKE